MTGIYLRCDKCGATLGGEQVTRHERGLHWSETSTLADEARRLGWTGALTRESNSDLCPACSVEWREGDPAKMHSPHSQEMKE